MIDIAMLSCNRVRITETVIRELTRRTTTPYRLLVVDNGSTDTTSEMLNELSMQNIVSHLILADENKGVHWGHNMLLHTLTEGYTRIKAEIETGEYYISADNDLIPMSPVAGRDWLEMLIDLADRNPDYAAIACRPHILIGEPRTRFKDAPELKQFAHVGAHLRLMRTQAVRDVGGWRKDVRPSRNNEEKWICGQLRKAGWKVGYARDIRCIHLFGDKTLGEDEHGYTAGTYHEGHREVWPPPSHYQWNRHGIDWETCRRADGRD